MMTPGALLGMGGEDAGTAPRHWCCQGIPCDATGGVGDLADQLDDVVPDLLAWMAQRTGVPQRLVDVTLTPLATTPVPSVIVGVLSADVRSEESAGSA